VSADASASISRTSDGKGRFVRVLVTGGAGFIGSNLVHHLAASGEFRLRVLDDLSAGQTAPDLPTAVEFRRADFTDREAVAAALENMDAVVHLAALSGVVDSIADPQPSFAVNVAGTFQLLELARQAGIRRFVNASTGGALLGQVAPPIDEGMAPSPLSPYGASKLAVEGYCSAFVGAYGLACMSLRFSNIYGPRSAHKKSAIAAFIKQALLGEPLIVYGDGTQRRDYLYVGDLAHGIRAALDSRVPGVYQLGSGQPTTLKQLVATLESVAGRPLPVRFEAARRGEVHSTWCRIEKSRREFGFTAPTVLAEGLAATWRWFAENRESWVGRAMRSSSD
jgi:UDP-glucose 4-epimerase